MGPPGARWILRGKNGPGGEVCHCQASDGDCGETAYKAVGVFSEGRLYHTAVCTQNPLGTFLLRLDLVKLVKEMEK